MKKYNRKAGCISEKELKEFDFLANEHDFIEITYWENGEGFDVEVTGKLQQRFQLTFGQFKAIKKIIKFLDKE